MYDYRDTPIKVGDFVAIYYGYNELKTAEIMMISGGLAKVDVIETRRDGTPTRTRSKWKPGSCMIKIDNPSS